MPSSHTSPSPCPSRTRSALGALGALGLGATLALGGCGDDSCGPGDAPGTGLLVSSADVTLEYGNLSSLSGNDCPDPAAPAGVVSLSIEGTQTGGGGGLVTLCIPRPDLLGGGDRSLGSITSTADIRVIDLRGTVDGCSYAADASAPPSGIGYGTGVCDNGTSAAGFALTIDGAVGLRRTCGTTVDTVAVSIAGTVAVTSRDN